MHHVSQDNSAATSQESILRRPMLYDEPLKWFIFLSVMDLLFTCIVLKLGGQEVNWVANKILEVWDLYGLLGFKLIMVVIIILICDFVGRRNNPRGRFIALTAVGLTAIPVIMAIVQLLLFVHF
mgnify:CR=1 FL=1